MRKGKRDPSDLKRKIGRAMKGKRQNLIHEFPSSTEVESAPTKSGKLTVFELRALSVIGLVVASVAGRYFL